MFRISSLAFAALVLTSAAAFAADPVSPAAPEESPSSGSKATPMTPPVDNDAELDKSPPPTSPGQEHKGGPSINPQ
jgi:hypothetical protein